MVLRPVPGTITIQPGCCDLQFARQFVLQKSIAMLECSTSMLRSRLLISKMRLCTSDTCSFEQTEAATCTLPLQFAQKLSRLHTMVKLVHALLGQSVQAF